MTVQSFVNLLKFLKNNGKFRSKEIELLLNKPFCQKQFEPIMNENIKK